MSRRSAGGLLGFVRRLVPPPVTDSDADLLARWAGGRDEPAFAELVRRHAGLVLAVCRRRLGDSPDADDAAQAVFVALARNAGRVRESLPGWLYRAAYLTALKAAGRAGKRRLDPPVEVPVTDPPDRPAEAAELKSILDAELAALPDKFRGVAVLCLCEGRTNAEAAAVLGVPVGTVDSRLSTARQKLRDRLVRRGVAVAAAAGFEAALPTAGRAADGFIDGVLAAATGAVPAAGVTELADGVFPMTTTKAKAVAAVLVGLSVLGGTGTGVYLAAGDGPKPAEKAAADKKADDKKADPPPKVEAIEGTTTTFPNGSVMVKTWAKGFGPAATPGAAAAALGKPSRVPAEDGLPLGELFAHVEKEHGVIVRVDVAAFRRLGAVGEQPLPDMVKSIRDLRPVLPHQSAKLPLRELLSDALAQLPQAREGVGYAVQPRGDQLVIVPAYAPPTRPGAKDAGETSFVVPETVIGEQMWGPPVSLTVADRPLAEVLAELRTQTGANIVLDARCREKAAQPVTAELADVRLLAALRVTADMADLHAVWVDNVYYVTTAENALRIEARVTAELFGTPVAPPLAVESGRRPAPARLPLHPARPTWQTAALPRKGHHMSRIHPTAVIDPAAALAADVTVGPYVIIDGTAVVGPGCVLRPHCQLLGRVTLGANNDVGPGTVLGGAPQHLGYKGEDTAVEIGSGNTFREHCTVHRGMPTAAGITRVGDGNYFMTGSHVGHDAAVGNNCILVNGAALGGHSEVGDRAVLSAYSAVHQFCRVGRLAMLSGQTSVTKDAPPFWVFRDINTVGGVNVVGMRRAGIPAAEIQAVRAVFRMIYLQKLPISLAADRAEQQYAGLPAVQELVQFIRTSKRGIPGGHLYRGDSHAEAA